MCWKLWNFIAEAGPEKGEAGTIVRILVRFFRIRPENSAVHYQNCVSGFRDEVKIMRICRNVSAYDVKMLLKRSKFNVNICAYRWEFSDGWSIRIFHISFSLFCLSLQDISAGETIAKTQQRIICHTTRSRHVTRIRDLNIKLIKSTHRRNLARMERQFSRTTKITPSNKKMGKQRKIQIE